LTGRVIDASGNAVANATVTSTGVDNSQVRSATSGTDGLYKFEGLPPGNYRLKFEATGLKTSEIPSTTVDGTEMTVPDEKLEAGESVSSKPAAGRSAKSSIISEFWWIVDKQEVIRGFNWQTIRLNWWGNLDDDRPRRLGTGSMRQTLRHPAHHCRILAPEAMFTAHRP
jgi:hypothetical protein